MATRHRTRLKTGAHAGRPNQSSPLSATDLLTAYDAALIASSYSLRI